MLRTNSILVGLAIGEVPPRYLRELRGTFLLLYLRVSPNVFPLSLEDHLCHRLRFCMRYAHRDVLYAQSICNVFCFAL